jgi:hypothetical protein
MRKSSLSLFVHHTLKILRIWWLVVFYFLFLKIEPNLMWKSIHNGRGICNRLSSEVETQVGNGNSFPFFIQYVHIVAVHFIFFSCAVHDGWKATLGFSYFLDNFSTLPLRNSIHIIQCLCTNPLLQPISGILFVRGNLLSCYKF